MSQHKPPFTLETAYQKVKAAQALWNTRSPSRVAQAYTPTSIWRNRSTFLRGRAVITDFLARKWEKEKDYRLRKELFAQQDNRICVQFWYEYRDAYDAMVWKRCYGIEHWTFAADGKMEKRMMSGNDVVIGEDGRWFKDGVDVDGVALGEKDF
ncbi:hypothetical protein IMSHALPRED_009995 [Imshaugia aleurites]|uniref:DUF1348-domain-containing protein n=1 Tax=Imshaugia aleurites TaxID=172621 RepID=A0A8H3EQ30_9LECA|nr:hypothetical protein IMSHALPRED_009995 [Imshaugia aleurites]